MGSFRNTQTQDVIAVPDALDAQYEARPEMVRYVTDAEVADVKGAELDQQLRDSGLPLTGTADEKRERLAAHQNEIAELDSDLEHYDLPTTGTVDEKRERLAAHLNKEDKDA